MARFAAFLRGVNVGGNNKVPMAELRGLLANLAYTDVQTVLNSGNAVFSASGKADQHARDIRAAILAGIGVDVPVIVKSGIELEAMAKENQLAALADNHSRLFVTVTPGADSLAELAPIAVLVEAPEKIQLGTHALYLWCSNGVLESKAGAALMGKAGRAGTTHWATMAKVLAVL